MEVFSSSVEIRAAVAEAKSRDQRVGLVPTMGALHGGHLALVEEVARYCDVVVTWIFVNPTQFNEPKDYERYPRTLDKDVALLREHGVDFVFAPPVHEIYPAGLEAYYEQRSARVYAGDCARGMEGAYRPGHFDGVVHVCSCFFNIVRPDVVVFGEKDYQQLKVIEQLLRDLHLDIDIRPVEIRREESGLAQSSRNSLLASDSSAALISTALFEAQGKVAKGEQEVASLADGVRNVIAAGGLEVEYVEIVDCETLAPLTIVESQARLLVAVRDGEVRLIDNVSLGGAR